MNVIKNIRYLADRIQPDQIEKLEAGAALHKRHGNIEFKILSLEGDSLTVQAKQSKNFAGSYSDQKQLINRTKELFSPFIEGLKIHVHATPYTEHPISAIDKKWLQEMMLKHGVKLKTIEEETGIDKTNISAWVNGKRPMSNIVKAMFYYYFKNR